MTRCATVPPLPTPVSAPGKSQRYVVFPPPIFPLVPLFGRPTFRYEVIPDTVWQFEQKQGIGLGLNVAVNVRMTVRTHPSNTIRPVGPWPHGATPARQRVRGTPTCTTMMVSCYGLNARVGGGTYLNTRRQLAAAPLRLRHTAVAVAG